MDSPTMNPFCFTILTLTVAIVVAICLIKYVAEKLFYKDTKRYAPVVGTIFNLIWNFHRAHDFATDIARKHKTFKIWFPSHSETLVLDPENIEYVLKTNFSNYGKGWYHYDILSDLLGDGIFTVDGAKWKHQRKTSSYEFSTKILRDFSSGVFRENAVKLAHFVSASVKEDKSVEIQIMKKGDILSRFLESDETDTKYLKDIILSFIIAGKDTTASTLSWFLYMLCKNPLIQEKVAQEVWEAMKIKQGSSFDELANSITEEALDKMQYLHAALSETLRLYPAVPAEKKLCFSDDTLPDGYSIRKGEQLMYYPYAMGRMKYLWGDDAEEYRPERWLNEDGLFQPQSSFKFTAFQAGPRICLGKEFAYRQMKIFSAALVGSFRFKLSEEQKRVNYKLMLTLHIDGGLHLRASHRLKH